MAISWPRPTNFSAGQPNHAPEHNLINEHLNALQQTAERTLYGTGNPNGVHAAPIGSVFRNTEAGGWNGARVWRKDSGGIGNSGWVVESGDTGWRDVTSLAIPESLDPANSGTLAVRRTESGVSFHFLNLLLAPGSGSLHLTLSSDLVGFRPTSYFVFELPRSNSTTHRNMFAVNSGRISWYAEHVAGSTVVTTNRPPFGVQGIFPALTTEEGWPTTLPGAAA